LLGARALKNVKGYITMLIEGKNAVRQSLESDLTINKLMIDKNIASRRDEIVNLASKKRIKVEFLQKNILDKKSQTGHHQGYIAEAVEFTYSNVQFRRPQR